MEIELKFQVPPARRAELLKAVATASAHRVRLRAVYADTPDRRLAAAGLALRLRQEGRRWVQTLKGPGDGLMQRLEHEVVLPAQRGRPSLDAARHAGTPAGEALAKVLGAEGAALLQPLYTTDVTRVLRRVRHAGALVEIACDRGTLQAADGTPGAGERASIDEVEFELFSGDPAGLVALAARWAERFDLWWDPRTKSERGYRLALKQPVVPALRAAPSRLEPAATTASAYTGMLQATLAHALPNAAEIASGTGGPEHLHQLRVGLRRLRSVLRLFGAWGADAAAARALEVAWREPFTALGATRDSDVLAQTLQPALAAAGAPAFAWPAAAGAAAPAEIVRGPAFTALLLRTLAHALQPGAPQPGPLRDAAAAVLRRAWKQALRDAPDFVHAPVDAQHRARKRLKRFRYALELLLPLYRAGPAKRLQRRLARAADALGSLNDLYVAEDLLRPQAEADPAAWFAVGWVVARRETALAAAAEALHRLADAPQPWRKG